MLTPIPHTQIAELPIQSATAADHAELIAVWEASVRATHHFLAEADLLYYKGIIGRYFSQCNLYCIREQGAVSAHPVSDTSCGQILAFLGVNGSHIEMLFVQPAWRGHHLGTRLLTHALRTLGCRTVDVNEQNEAAYGFYVRHGFRLISRDPQDGCGRPYPILHLEI